MVSYTGGKILPVIKKLLPNVLWITFGAVLLIAGSFGVVELKHYINTVEEEAITNGYACVIHKSRPVHLPQSFLLVLVRQDGGEFYLMDEEIYNSLEERDCVQYRYHEYHEYDKSEGKKNARITGFSYDVKFLERKGKQTFSERRV